MKQGDEGQNYIESLFANKELYRILFENSSDAIFFAEKSKIVDCNKIACLMLGFTSKEEIIGQFLFDFSPELQPDGITSKQKNQELIALSIPETTAKFTWEFLKSDKTIIETEVILNSFNHENRIFQQFTIRNISNLNLNQKLKEVEMLQATLDSTTDGILVVNQLGKVTSYNKQFRQMFNLSEEMLKSGEAATAFEFVSNQIRNPTQFLNKVHFLYDNSELESFDIIELIDGRVLERVSHPQQLDGKQIGIVWNFRDITDRKQAEESLRQSEMKYRNLIETMPDGVYRSTPEGKFVEVNPAMVKMLGYKNKEELLAIDIKTDLYFDLSDRENPHLNQSPQNLDVYPLKKKDGTAVWVEDHGWYVTNENGQILFHEGISRDVTDHKMAEIQLQQYLEELQEMNATKDKFFSIIAHDLKSPFNSILGLSEIIKNEAKDLDIKTIERYAGIIHSTSENTFRLLENLLDWARIQQSQISFRPIQVILKKIVGEVVEMLAEKANSKMIAIFNYIPDNLIVMADEDMLKTIFRNLISNTLKFTPANGKVEIKAVSTGDTFEISVKDTGIGIKQEDFSKIFKIGSSFSNPGTDNEKGTGLGLLLCKEFVEKHGGKIRVESEEGNGSTFTFSIINSDSFLTTN